MDVDDAFTEPNTWGTIEVSHSFQSFETGGGFEFFFGFECINYYMKKLYKKNLEDLVKYMSYKYRRKKKSSHLDRAKRREVSIIIFGIGFCGCIGISYGDFMGIGF